MDMRESSGMNEMRDALAKMAQQQQELISQGVSTREIAGQRIVPAETFENGA